MATVTKQTRELVSQSLEHHREVVAEMQAAMTMALEELNLEDGNYHELSQMFGISPANVVRILSGRAPHHEG